MSRTADDFLALEPQLLDEDRTSERAIAALVAVTAPMAAYFRFSVHGWGQVPEGPCLFVANHNAAALQEVLLLLRAWRLRWGDRPVRGLLHRIAWERPFRWLPLLHSLGGVYAHHQVARRALEAGQSLLVFPGGDVEAMRPFSKRYRIHFDGRTGFAKLAREAGVPIVPLVLCGAHATFVMLPGSRQLGRWLGLEQRLGFKGFPLTGGFVLAAAALAVTVANSASWPLLLLAMAQSVIPVPSRIDARLLEPIEPSAADRPEALAALVQARMQAAMNGMAAARRTPWW